MSKAETAASSTPGETSAATPDVTVYYDGACPLCVREIGLYRTCAGSDRLAFVDVAAEPTSAIAPDLTTRAARARFHVRRADGSLASGAAGFASLWLALPGWRWLGRLVSLPGIRLLTEGAYRGFLVFRPAIQALVRRWDRRRDGVGR